MTKSSPSPPPVPNAGETAAAQGAANKDTAYWNAVLNNVNQITPYGNLTYTKTGGDTYNQAAYDKAIAEYNTMTAAEKKNANRPTLEDFRDAPQFTSQIDLSPEQQQLLDTQQRSQLGLAGLGEEQIGRIGESVSSPYSYEGLPQVFGEGDTTQAQSRAEEALYSRLNPQFERDESKLRTRLINQGITQGSDAYNKEFDTFNQAKNDARMQTILSGQQYASALLGDSLQRRNQGIQEYTTTRNAPLNEYIGLTSGTQVQNPQFSSQGYQGAAPADYAGAIQNAYQGNLGAYNAKVAGNNANTSGLFGLGGSFLGAAGAADGIGPLFAGLSDERAKENIVHIGEENGHNIYEFNYVWGGPREIGVMAQEVEKTRPDAVIDIAGLKFVNYDVIGVERRVA